MVCISKETIVDGTNLVIINSDNGQQLYGQVFSKSALFEKLSCVTIGGGKCREARKPVREFRFFVTFCLHEGFS